MAPSNMGQPTDREIIERLNLTWLVYYTLVGDGGHVREVHVRAVEALNEDGARRRIVAWFGAGYLHILKVERVA